MALQNSALALEKKQKPILSMFDPAPSKRSAIAITAARSDSSSVTAYRKIASSQSLTLFRLDSTQKARSLTGSALPAGAPEILAASARNGVAMRSAAFARGIDEEFCITVAHAFNCSGNFDSGFVAQAAGRWRGATVLAADL
jgi:hypothetical protein